MLPDLSPEDGSLNLSAVGITLVAIWVFHSYRIDRDVPPETRRALAEVENGT